MREGKAPSAISWTKGENQQQSPPPAAHSLIQSSSLLSPCLLFVCGSRAACLLVSTCLALQVFVPRMVAAVCCWDGESRNLVHRCQKLRITSVWRPELPVLGLCDRSSSNQIGLNTVSCHTCETTYEQANKQINGVTYTKSISQAFEIIDRRGCSFRGMYVPCIYRTRGDSYQRRFRSLLLCPVLRV